MIDLYGTLARVRAFERAAEVASQSGAGVPGAEVDVRAKVRGMMRLSMGQETVAAGVCARLRREALPTSTHRGHARTPAKGLGMRRMMAELFGSTGRKGDSMRIANFSVGKRGASGLVAAGLPIACGAAHALELQGKLNLVDQTHYRACP